MAADVTPRTGPPSPSPLSPSNGHSEAAVHPAGSYRAAGFRWGYFLILNGISAVAAIAVFVGIAHGEVLDPYMLGTYRWLLAHPMATSAMAFSPLAASMLVGWGYSQRARKRRAAATAALARSAARPGAGEQVA